MPKIDSRQVLALLLKGQDVKESQINIPMDEIRSQRVARKSDDLRIELKEINAIKRVYNSSLKSMGKIFNHLNLLNELTQKISKDVVSTDTINQYKSSYSVLSRAIAADFLEPVAINQHTFSFDNEEHKIDLPQIHNSIELIRELGKLYAKVIPSSQALLSNVYDLVNNRAEISQEESTLTYQSLTDEMKTLYGQTHHELSILMQRFLEWETNRTSENIVDSKQKINLSGSDMMVKIESLSQIKPNKINRC